MNRVAETIKYCQGYGGDVYEYGRMKEKCPTKMTMNAIRVMRLGAVVAGIILSSHYAKGDQRY
jgi:hypothetical protein